MAFSHSHFVILGKMNRFVHLGELEKSRRKGRVLMKRKQRIGIAVLAAVLTVGVQITGGGGISEAAVTAKTADSWDGTADTSWYDGHENESSYEITTAEELAGMAEIANTKQVGFDGKTIRLMSDLDLEGYEWPSIGINGYNYGNGAFKGIFDGQNHVIKNMTTKKKGRGHGLFTVISQGTVKNLGLEDADVYIPADDDWFRSGILADWASVGKIYNCYTTGVILSERKDANSYGLGGLIGQCTAGTEIIGCYSSASVLCDIPAGDGDSDEPGGIVGQWNNSRDESRISDCYFDGRIRCTNENSEVGGILGADPTFSSGSGVLVENCFVMPEAVECDANPENFCYIATVGDKGTIRNCYYSEPVSPSGQESYYNPAVRLIVDWGQGTAGPDPDYVPDVELIEDMTDAGFLTKLKAKASQNPSVTWVKGVDHPVFAWDVKNIPPVLSVTATASDATNALLSASSDSEGELYYAVGGDGFAVPASQDVLEQLVQNPDQTVAAAGKLNVEANKVATAGIAGLKPGEEYTVAAAVKNPHGTWSKLILVKFQTGQEKLAGAVILSGFPVAGETLSAAVAGMQEDAVPLYTWYRGKTKIDGETSDTYILSSDDIGKKVHVEVTAAGYKGSLVSNATPAVAEDYTVTKLSVTKKPDKLVYGRDEAFDKTGMEVTAYLKASASNAAYAVATGSNATPGTVKKILSEAEYQADYDFSRTGKAEVTITYMDASTSFEVTVTDDVLEGEVVLTGLPVPGETLRAEVSGAQNGAKLSYSWYRDKAKISGAAKDSYLLTAEDAGHRIHVEVSAAGYAGTLVSDPTDVIRTGYVVSGIQVTKMPDKMSYTRYGKFDSTGMEVTAFLKVNSLDQTAAAKKVLNAGEYQVDYSFDKTGTQTVTVIYRWNGAVYTDSFDVAVTGTSSGGSSGSSSGGSSSRSAGSGKTGVPVPVQGDWIQEADGSWSFRKQGGEKAVSEWIYTGNTGGEGSINSWYAFDEKGRMRTGWFMDVDGRWYYLNEAHDGTYGAMVTGWIFGKDGYWYYLNPEDGAMMTGWKLIGGKWYYFHPLPDGLRGAMAADAWIDGWYVGKDGAWVE